MAERVTRSRVTMRQAGTHSGRSIAAIRTISARKRPVPFRKYSQAQRWLRLWARPADCRTREESRSICNEKVSGQLSKSEDGRTVVSVGCAGGGEGIPELGRW